MDWIEKENGPTEAVTTVDGGLNLLLAKSIWMFSFVFLFLSYEFVSNWTDTRIEKEKRKFRFLAQQMAHERRLKEDWRVTVHDGWADDAGQLSNARESSKREKQQNENAGTELCSGLTISISVWECFILYSVCTPYAWWGGVEQDLLTQQTNRKVGEANPCLLIVPKRNFIFFFI